ncbi:MAG: twin-arginine translocase TatA/TatE family subunit [Candidatus Bathyarchaeia archaeon]
MFPTVGSDQTVLFIPTMQGMEWIILIVIAVILIFGAKKIPELARSIGRASGEFQRGKVESEKEAKSQVESSTAKLETPDREKLLKIAQDLGIDTSGKTESELREEIAKAMMR